MGTSTATPHPWPLAWSNDARHICIWNKCCIIWAAWLVQHVEFLAQSTSLFGSGTPHSKWTSSYVTSCQGTDMIAAGTTGRWNNVPMLIPPIAPSRLAGCGIINANYVLKVCQVVALVGCSGLCSRFFWETIMPVVIMMINVDLSGSLRQQTIKEQWDGTLEWRMVKLKMTWSWEMEKAQDHMVWRVMLAACVWSEVKKKRVNKWMNYLNLSWGKANCTRVIGRQGKVR